MLAFVDVGQACYFNGILMCGTTVLLESHVMPFLSTSLLCAVTKIYPVCSWVAAQKEVNCLAKAACRALVDKEVSVFCLWSPAPMLYISQSSKARKMAKPFELYLKTT